MSQSRLRLFNHNGAGTDETSQPNEKQMVSVPFGKFTEVIREAMMNNSTWILDFADDNVQIDKDLYDVVLAYQQLTRNRAA